MPRKKPRTGSTAAKPERPPRGSKIDPWDADYLTTNPKSALVEADIIVSCSSSCASLNTHVDQGLLSSPELWESLSKEEREEIDSIFPDHVPRDEDGTISLKWLRYDDDWRHGIRQWQADLGAGRLEPKWQREAAIAMEERAAGAFDKFKEEEFESFWGQKQKIDRQMRAGESFVLKLADLIAAKLFKVGDIWVYSRVYGRGKQERIHVIKDCRVRSSLILLWLKSFLKLNRLRRLEKSP